MSTSGISAISSSANALLSGLLGPGVSPRLIPARRVSTPVPGLDGVHWSERSTSSAQGARQWPAPGSIRPASTPVQATAYQRNADGDEASLTSRQGDMTEAERAEVEALRARDAEVRAHEQAHLSAAGGLARGGASFEYQTGPDGRRYAIGGHVQIDTSPVPGDPEATIVKARQIRAAALAPAQPSGADRAVAAQATRMEAEARRTLAEGDQNGNPGERSPLNAVESPVSGLPGPASDARPWQRERWAEPNSIGSRMAVIPGSPASSGGALDVLG